MSSIADKAEGQTLGDILARAMENPGLISETEFLERIRTMSPAEAAMFIRERDRLNVAYGRNQEERLIDSQIEDAHSNGRRGHEEMVREGFLDFRRAFDGGLKIEAIKSVRSMTGWSLKETKDFVESFKAFQVSDQRAVDMAEVFMVLVRDAEHLHYGDPVWKIDSTFDQYAFHDARQRAVEVAEANVSEYEQVKVVSLLGESKPVLKMRA